MNETDDNLISILMLVVLYRLPLRANSYDLTRILEWKFKYFNAGHILLQLEEKGHISIIKEFPTTKYILEEKGKIFIKEQISGFRNRLFAEFPEETELLSSLLDDKSKWE